MFKKKPEPKPEAKVEQPEPKPQPVSDVDLRWIAEGTHSTTTEHNKDSACVLVPSVEFYSVEYRRDQQFVGDPTFAPLIKKEWLRVVSVSEMAVELLDLRQRMRKIKDGQEAMK